MRTCSFQNSPLKMHPKSYLEHIHEFERGIRYPLNIHKLGEGTHVQVGKSLAYIKKFWRNLIGRPRHNSNIGKARLLRNTAPFGII